MTFLSTPLLEMSSLLKILPDENTLSAGSPFLEPVPWPPEEESDQPRALRGLSRIIDGGLCHRCGSCIGICPTGVLSLDEEEYPTVTNLSACTDCDLCVKVCPGDEFQYEAESKAKFGEDVSITDTHGNFNSALLAHATDPTLRENSTSGGLVTGLLLHLLRSGKIDGAVVIASDDDTLWKGKPIIARTEEDLLKAVKSKYAISPSNVMFNEILSTPGKYALVGLPCQIHGFVKAAELQEALRERVVLTIGLFCHAAIEHEAFRIIWESLGDKAHGAKRFISRIGKHPGAPHIECADGSFYPVYFGEKNGYQPSSMEMINILYRLYTPKRCLTCFDALSEFADISVGDPWMAPPEDDISFLEGWSFALARTARGEEALRLGVEAEEIVSRRVTNDEAMRCNKQMATEKRWRAFRMIETHRRQGKSIPNYGRTIEHFPRHKGLQFVETEMHMLTHMGCFLPKIRGAMLRFFLGNGGYYFLWLNSKRRAVKFWIRDNYALLKRKLFGRKEDSVKKNDGEPWAINLFRRSPLKQKKFQEITALLPNDISRLHCLDVGADNGVISYLLRKQGGVWSSTDLIPETVNSIAQLVHERVYLIEDGVLPLEDSSFDLIVIVDLLEHLEEDKKFVEECARLLKEGGAFIVNVPNPKEGLLRWVRFKLGQTDEKHGHLRPGYSLEQLKELFGDSFEVIEAKSYSRLFSQLVDTLIQGGLSLLKAGKGGKKGVLVTKETMKKKKFEFFLFSCLYPFLKGAVLLDDLIPITRGGMLIVKAKKVTSSSFSS